MSEISMSDTPPAVAARYRTMLLSKTFEERVRMSCSMFDMAKRLVIASLQSGPQPLSPAQLKERVFLRFYGEDFDEQQRQKIVRHLRRTMP